MDILYYWKPFIGDALGGGNQPGDNENQGLLLFPGPRFRWGGASFFDHIFVLGSSFYHHFYSHAPVFYRFRLRNLTCLHRRNVATHRNASFTVALAERREVRLCGKGRLKWALGMRSIYYELDNFTYQPAGAISSDNYFKI